MVESPAQSYRGVRCLTCTQPIPLPAILASIDFEAEEKDPDVSVRCRVFSLRCRSCEREKLYHAHQVETFEGAPKPRVSRARRPLPSSSPHGLPNSKAARA
jgi:hypothetical protein